jgi:hypothetical protein
MAVLVNTFGIKRYLTGNKIADVLRCLAKAVHLDLSADEIKHFPSNLGKVWVLVLLDEAAMTPDFMTSCLGFMGEPYKLYLCDTLILQQKHVNALNTESDEVMHLLGSNRNILPNIIPVDNKMGEY